MSLPGPSGFRRERRTNQSLVDSGRYNFGRQHRERPRSAILGVCDSRHIHAIVVRNAGRVATNNVRIGHDVLPDQFQLSPSIPHTVERTAGAIAEIIIPKLVPDEQVTISYLYVPPLLWSQIHAYTKSDEGFAKILNVLLTPQFPKWTSRGIWTLVFFSAQHL